MMAITLGALTLDDNLAWIDEYAWTPIQQSAPVYSLTGALLIQEATKLAGRPITLGGGAVWPTKTQLDALMVLATAGASLTLTLHDARTFTVTFRHDGNGPLTVDWLGIPTADPDAESQYLLKEIRLMEV